MAGASKARFGSTMLAVTAFAVLVAVACGGGSPNPTANGEGAPTAPPASDRTWAGTDPAPPFPSGLTWFNVANAPTLDDLRGKMVLLDFWTLGCINCQHIIPDLARLEEEFEDSLVVIGVHSGKYEAEHDNESIREAIERFGLKHPVVNDPDFVFWNTYGARAWPTVALIDPAGNIVGGHSGEGIYPLFAPILAALELEFEGRINAEPFPLALQQSVASTVLSYPAALVADEGRGRLYIADSGHNRILEATLEGALLRVFGSGEQGFADGGASEAQFYDPQGLELSADGRRLYVADTRNHALRAVDLDSGVVETLAGTGNRLRAFPQAGADPRGVDLASPWGLLRVEDTLYIAMAGVHQLWTYDLDANTIAVFAGTSREGIDDGLRLSEATLAQPSGITTDGQYVYWVDPESSSIRRVMAGGEIVDTLVGTGLFDWGDADGGPGMGQVQHAQGIVYHDGLLYVADTYNNRLKTLDPVSIQLSTVAGSGAGEWQDGPGREAAFDEPSGLAVAGGAILVADTNNHAIRRYDPRSGEVTTLQLSNLAVAAGTAGAGVVRVDLAEQVVAPGASNLRVKFSTPAGYHLNSLAPSELRLSAANGGVVELGESDLSWETDERSVEIPVPVQLGEGETTLTAVGTAYFCGDGQEALCLIQRLEFVIPVVVRAGATQGELLLEYELGGDDAAGS